MTRAEPPSLADALSSRGWTLDAPVQAEGLMARGRASLGLVTRVSDGAQGFAKCIWHAKASAGSETRLLASPERLRRVAGRLQTLAGLAGVPLVKILDVAMINSPPALLLVMDRVTPIAELLLGTPNDALAAEILRRFCPSPMGPHWTHFDICPANSGVTAAGTPVLIDPESAYLLDRAEAVIDESCLVAKWHRSPAFWEADLSAALGAGEPLGDLPLKKHAVEVCLLAAEVSLGRAAEFVGVGRLHMEDWLLPWLAQVERDPTLRSRARFWRRHLTAALDRDFSPDLGAIAIELATLFDGSSSAVLVTGGDMRAREMRRNRLDAPALRDYLADLLAVGRASTDVDPWFEAGMVCVCFLRDKALAQTVVTEACERHPEDPVLHQWARMIAMWPGAGGT